MHTDARFYVAFAAVCFSAAVGGFFLGWVGPARSVHVEHVPVVQKLRVADMTLAELKANLGPPQTQGVQNGTTCGQWVSNAGGQHLIAVCWR